MQLMYFLWSSLAFQSAESGPAIYNYDPPVADEWEQSVVFRCGLSTLRISGYGPARPLHRPVKITFDGEQVTGDRLPLLLTDLKRPRARYHIGAVCGRDGRFGLRIYTGEKSEAGDVLFHVGSAAVRDGVLLSYEGLESANADDFWFR